LPIRVSSSSSFLSSLVNTKKAI